MDRRAICVAASLTCVLVNVPGARGEGRGVSAAAQSVYKIELNLYEQTPGNCVVGYPEQVEVDSGDIVIWEIINKCKKDKDVKLEFAQNPLNKKCKLAEKPGKDESLLLICKVTTMLNPGDPPKTYKYSIKGDFNVDPKLIVRPPSTLCELCRKVCP